MKEDYTFGEFTEKMDPKEGFAVVDCNDPRVRVILAFFILIFYPEKSTPMTITLASIILEALRQKRKVDWALLMHELVSKMVTTLPKAKSTPLLSYLVHLYHYYKLLRREEIVSWEA